MSARIRRECGLQRQRLRHSVCLLAGRGQRLDWMGGSSATWWAARGRQRSLDHASSSTAGVTSHGWPCHASSPGHVSVGWSFFLPPPRPPIFKLHPELARCCSTCSRTAVSRADRPAVDVEAALCAVMRHQPKIQIRVRQIFDRRPPTDLAITNRYLASLPVKLSTSSRSSPPLHRATTRQASSSSNVCFCFHRVLPPSIKQSFPTVPAASSSSSCPSETRVIRFYRMRNPFVVVR